MRIHNEATGETYFRKLRKRIDEPGHARELTFSCYKRFKFLESDQTRQWFIDELANARQSYSIDLWAYVIMPEHVHLLIYPTDPNTKVGIIAGKIKEAVARKAIDYLQVNSREWLKRITVNEGDRTRRRFWQPGGGYDCNAVELSTIEKMIEYIHLNPVRRGLVMRPEDYRWSSAQWYAGIKPVPIEMDATIPMSHQAGTKPR